jgi:DNA/RNA-binding domain of Phe-tRNA-synthetase-like protein
MRRTASSGDLALAAVPATPETFAPYGKLLVEGSRTLLGRRGRVLLAMDERRPGPRRVTHLQRYPEAKRGFLALGATPMWLVVLRDGDPALAEPAAFLIPPGACVIISPGVWHAGPVPLAESPVCEVLEAIGNADRFDRKSLPDLCESLAVRVLLPAEHEQPGGGIDLGAPNAVLLDASLHGRLRLGCLSFEGLDLGRDPAPLDKELKDAAEGLRQMWRHVTDLAEIPGVSAGRELFEELGIDQQRFPPRAEGALDKLLRGRTPKVQNPLDAALLLCTLRMRLPISGHDAASLGHPILVRTGGSGEAYPGTGRNRVVVKGRPVLCDPEGPFGSPIGDARRTRFQANTERALVVIYVPTSADPSELEKRLDAIARTVVEHCGGRATGRLVVG